MSEVYKIAVKLVLESNATSVLGGMSSMLFGLEKQIGKVEGGLGRLNRVKLAVFGGLGIAAGGALLSGLKLVTDQARELSHQLAGIRTFKMDPSAGAALAVQADTIARATTRLVAGSTESGNAKLFGETFSMFGAANAAKINAPLAKFGRVLGDITGDPESAQEQLYSLVRAGELSGKIVNPKTHEVDTDRLMGFLDLAAKVAAATHGKVGPNQIFALAQQGAPALKGMDDDGILTMSMAAQAMGGFRSGTAAMSMFSQFAGGKMTAQVAEELHKYGLIGDFHTIRGGGVQFEKGALETDFIKALRKDPAAGAQRLQDTLHKAGLGDDQIGTEIFKILGRQTTQRLMSDLLSNLPQMLAERGRIKGAQGVDGQYETRNSADYITNENNLRAAWTNLMQAVAGPQASVAIDLMQRLTGGLNVMTDAVRGTNPDVLRGVAVGVGALGVALVGGGAAALVLALGPAGWLIGGLAALGVGMTAFKPQLDTFSKALFNWTEAMRKEGDKAGKWLFDLTEKFKDFGVKGIASLTNEIASWPSRLGGAIASMGSALVAAIGGTLTGLIAQIRGFLHINFAGAGVGGGGFTNASYGVGGIGGGIWDGRALAVGSGTGVGHTASETERAAFIRAYAAHVGIDPTTALRVAQSEGFRQFTGDYGTSFGDFQMHVGGGLGDKLRAMGINPADPHQWMKSDAFALNWASSHGWHDWHGAARAGISDHQGIGRARAAGVPKSIQRPIEIHHKTMLDRKVLATAVTKYQVEALNLPGSIGPHDSYSSYAAAGSTMFPA